MTGRHDLKTLAEAGKICKTDVADQIPSNFLDSYKLYPRLSKHYSIIQTCAIDELILDKMLEFVNVF